MSMRFLKCIEHYIEGSEGMATAVLVTFRRPAGIATRSRAGVESVLIMLGMLVSLFIGPTQCGAEDWVFFPVASVAETYDSNVLFSSTDPLHDFISSPKALFTLARNTEDSQFNTVGTVRGDIYVLNSNLNTVEGNIRSVFSRQWTERFSGGINGSFVKTTTLESQLQAAGIQAFREDQYIYDAGANGRYSFSDLFALSTDALVSRTEYPASDPRFPDSDSLSVGLVPGWTINPLNTVGLQTGYSLKDYENSTKVHNLFGMLYWERPFSEALSTNVAAGMRFSRVEQVVSVLDRTPDGRLDFVKKDVTDDDSGFVFNATVRKDWSERLSSWFAAGQELYSDVNARTFNHIFGRVSGSYLLTEIDTISCELRYDYNTEIRPGDEKTNYVRVAPYIEHKFTPDFALRWSGSFEYQLTQLRASDSNANRYRTSLELTYQIPRLWASH
jgi:hypothetical protein